MAYQVSYTEPAEEDIDSAYLWLSRRSPEFAVRWYNDLRAAVAALADMPRRYQMVPEFGPGVRRMVYGSGGSRYLVLYMVIEPDPPEEEEGIVRILHVYHGARRIASPRREDDETADEEET